MTKLLPDLLTTRPLFKCAGGYEQHNKGEPGRRMYCDNSSGWSIKRTRCNCKRQARAWHVAMMEVTSMDKHTVAETHCSSPQ